MNLLFLQYVISVLCITLVILCMLVPLKKESRFSKILTYHKIYAFLLFTLSLIHGILAGNKPGMLSGKLAWLALFVLILSSYIIKNTSSKWKNIHLTLSLVFITSVILHIYYALITV